LACTVIQEARFRWTRSEILHTNPLELEKVGRHIIVGYTSLTEVRKLVELRGVGGVFVSSWNVRDKNVAQLRHEIESLQHIRKQQNLPPLWIATDQEGGVVSRLSPPLPHQPALSELVKRSPDMAHLERAVRKYGKTQGKGLAEVGVNLNFAPVVDLNHNVVNPNDKFTRIYQRAISNDPKTVEQVAGWYCAGLEESGVQCTLKHFPGLGRVFEDTHNSDARLATSMTELLKTDLAPFRMLMRKSKAFTMLSHVKLTAQDRKNPVSISPAVITKLIRGDWDYDGILITDNVTMAAIYRSKPGMAQGSVQALNAGVDLILISYDTDQYYSVMHALLKAYRNGILSRKTLERSDQRLERSVRSLQNTK
jgi:beta-N-acetylhexosaminidase